MGHSRRLVVDANVAHSAGESEHPISIACRNFLKTVSCVGHRIVLTDAIHEEWRRHYSRFSLQWLAQMTSRKKVVAIVGERNASLRCRIDASIPREQQKAVAKDTHLIEAALATDCRITSADKRARRAFAHASANVSELRQIV